jgi:hypothetical protein
MPFYDTSYAYPSRPEYTAPRTISNDAGRDEETFLSALFWAFRSLYGRTETLPPSDALAAATAVTAAYALVLLASSGLWGWATVAAIFWPILPIVTWAARWFFTSVMAAILPPGVMHGV